MIFQLQIEANLTVLAILFYLRNPTVASMIFYLQINANLTLVSILFNLRNPIVVLINLLV